MAVDKVIVDLIMPKPRKCVCGECITCKEWQYNIKYRQKRRLAGNPVRQKYVRRKPYINGVVSFKSQELDEKMNRYFAMKGW